MRNCSLAKVLIGVSCFLWFMGIIPSCQDDCVDFNDFRVVEFDVDVNEVNRGILSSSVQNGVDTIKSETNQFLSSSARVFVENLRRKQHFTFMNEIYAKQSCPQLERSVTTFIPDSLEIYINQSYDAAFIGGSIISANTNLMENELLRLEFLNAIFNKTQLFQGFEVPFGVNRNFFSPINKKEVQFKFNFVDENGDRFESNFNAFIDYEF